MPEFPGGLWDNPTFTIEQDYVHEVRKSDLQPCPHAHSPRPARLPQDTKYCAWTIPRVVIATNEGGHATTGLCLDCILAAAEEMNEQEIDRFSWLSEPDP